MSTQSQYHVTVAIDGKSIGAFDSRTGGETDSEITVKWTGEGRKAYPGRATEGDLTVVRGFERDRDHELARQLVKRAGRAPMTVTEQPVDDWGNAWGRPITWTGVLKSVNRGDYDAENDDPRELELTMVVKGTN